MCQQLEDIQGVANDLKRRFKANPQRSYREMNFWFFMDLINQADSFAEMHLSDCPICAMEKLQWKERDR